MQQAFIVDEPNNKAITFITQIQRL